MTYQIEDGFRYEGDTFTLVACSAGEPFTPQRLGIRPNMAGTACWRGYRSTYGLARDRLVVAELRFQLVEDGIDFVRVPGPVINGVEPLEEAAGIDWFNNNYLGLNLPVVYDGGLIIGRGYHEEYHGDLDRITLWKYETVLELRFQRGRLSQVRDLSSAVLPIRQFADEKSALLKAFMNDLGAAMSAADGEEERRAVKSAYFGARKESVFDAAMDDIAREKLTGLIDASYLGS